MKKKKYKTVEYVYPDDPHEHILKQRQKKNPPPVDENYNYESKNIFFKLFSWFFYSLAWLLLPIWAAFWMRPIVKGRKYLRQVRKQGVIMVANHIHKLDAPIICACANRSRKIRFVMLKENLDIPVTGQFLRALGGIPLGSTMGGMKNFSRYVHSLLERKKAVLIYPEAALWPYYTKLRPFLNGAFVFATKSKVPVLPMVYTFKVNKRGKKTRMVLNILPPIPYREGVTIKQLADETHAAMQKALDDFYANERYNKCDKKIAVHKSEKQKSKAADKNAPEASAANNAEESSAPSDDTTT